MEGPQLTLIETDVHLFLQKIHKSFGSTKSITTIIAATTTATNQHFDGAKLQ